MLKPRAWPRSSHHNITKTKLLTMDILVLATMKNAVKCDTQCELQNSVNHQSFERILHSEVFLIVCLSQWHLPLSHPGFTPHPAVREECELVTALAAVSLQVQSRPAWRQLICLAWRSVVVGAPSRRPLPIADARSSAVSPAWRCFRLEIEAGLGASRSSRHLARGAGGAHAPLNLALRSSKATC